MALFVTVGSTGFDALVGTITSQLEQISGHIHKVTIQYGTSESIYRRNIGVNQPVQIQGYDYKPSIEEDIQEADIIVSHAGAGTILQALRLKKKLILVTNTLFMDNHQNELAEAMEKHKYAVCSTISDLVHTILNIDRYDLQPFPDSNKEIFANIVNKQMNMS